MKGMILAAGYGTRLRPLTYSMPKPMLRIGNRPLIGYAVENYLRAGVNEIVVNLHHLPEIIDRFLTARYGSQCKLHFSEETEILGTGGGVRKVRSLLETEDEFFLVNGDTIQFPPYDHLHQIRWEKDALAALTLRHPPAGDRFTAVWFEDGLVTGFGTGTGEPLMFSGAHAISSRIFQCLPESEFSGIVNDVYQPVIADKREVVVGVIDDGPWFDIGTPQRYIAAHATVLDMTIRGDIEVERGSRIVGDSIVDQTASIHGKLARSSVGARSYVKGEAHDSIIGGACHIAGGAVLRSCIVGDGVEVIRSMEIRNAIVCREDEVPRDPNYRYESGLVIAEF
jgi:NDP-sugar pyrophosphorylase family protein